MLRGIILKIALNKWGGKVWIGFIYPRIGFSGGTLVNALITSKFP
jgi:hypothetical protein